MKIYIVPKENGKQELNFAYKLEKILSINHTVCIQNYARWKSFIDRVINSADLVISIGGDGTFLRTILQMDVQRPIIGINFGTVGFLTDVEKENGIDVIQEIINKPLKIEERMRIDVLYNNKIIGTALNEVTFTSTSDHMIEYMVCVDDVIATKFRGDGLIISTPTGSTAYAMSAGGPVTDPRVKGFLLVPIAPFFLSSRPQIVHGSRKIIVDANNSRVRIDGEILNFTVSHPIEIKVSKNPALFVDVGRNFFEKVNTKMKVI